MIEDTSQCYWGSRPDLPYLNVRYPVYDQKLVINRQLSIKEFWRLKKERYSDKDGWVLSRYAYLLKTPVLIAESRYTQLIKVLRQ